MVEVSNKVYAALEIIGQDLVCDLAIALNRAKKLHPEFATSTADAATVVYNEACELVAAVHDKESPDRQRAEALDTAVTAIRFMRLEWLPKFGVSKPVEASEGVKVAFDADDDFEGLGEAPGASGCGPIPREGLPVRLMTEDEYTRFLGEQKEPGVKCKTRQRGSVLREAIDIINGERQDVYGSPEDSFSKIADYWTTYLGDQMTDRITAEDVALMMTLFKIAREANQHKRDNILDAAGYLGIYADMQEG